VIGKQSLADVRFAPETGQIADISGCPLCANCDRTQRSKVRVLFDYLIAASKHGRRNCAAEWAALIQPVLHRHRPHAF
jgi:hypothetical protein